MATAVLIGCGAVASVLAAGAVRRSNADESLKSFQKSSASVASTLQLAIEHDNDIVADAGGLLANPNLTKTEFDEWASAARMFDRYPEMTGIGTVVLVDAAALPAFAARAVADPAGTLAVDGTFAVVPAGARPFYCLASAGVTRASATATPAGLDYCADPANDIPLIAARDSGQGDYLPYTVGGRTLLSIQTPIYRGGVQPATVAGRRAAFVGWVGTSVDPAVLLIRALRDQRGLSVAMRYHVGAQDVAFTHGAVAAGARSATIDLHNGWTVQSFGVVSRGAITTGDALAVLLAGIALSALLGLLMFVLGTGRERARRQLEQRTGQLHHQALHDALTGLPNRALLMDRIAQMLVWDRRHHTTGALLFLDLDDFKNVNDTLGHGAGDRLLIAVAARLASTLRDADTIARMGGDEFVVLIDGASVDVAPELVAERLLEVMRQPFELDSTTMPLSVNISIGIASGDRDSAGELLRDADIALYQAKAAGKNRYEVFDPLMQTRISRRTDLEFDLRSALNRQEYRLVYQPIYNLEDLTVVGVEALLRWDHPTRGLISPDEFIPILEQTGQIREVGGWVLQHACRQMAAWHARGDILDISVNVSGRQLDDDSIIADVRAALAVSALPATSLIIEVTEATLMHGVEATARRLNAIKALGVRIAVDDFGAGYSSLAYLRQFPVDCLKIDRVFTNAITTSPESKALVGTLVQLGKDLGLRTLAEGVETPEEMDLLRGADINQAQGFLMSRPLDPATLEEQLLEPTRPATPTTTRT
ncbi:EAL domain-containing protein [uncultured Jatrophihabitans sp.]|uniref:bifunctional diguanylate cyclase/phosphodiesterase n=1 Tax=uncultured Jatrophihabitans sp. TaxID=1610747 RepID=UPI0035CB02A3